jgi:TonB family protein
MEIAKVASAVQPAVVSISVFEPTGKLLRTGTGIFVSSDGKVLTTRSLVEGATHAIAKTNDNQIHNVSGILTDAAADDLAVLNVEVKERVPSVVPNTVANVEQGAAIAVIQSPLGRARNPVLEATVAKIHKGARGEWLELSKLVTSDGMGAPVVNGNGDVIGLVTHGTGDSALMVRTSATLNAVLARAPIEGKGKWFVEESAAPPAEGPLRQVPLAQNPQGRQSKLVYSPPPAYPSAAGRNAGPLRGTGRFRLTFNANGQVVNIAIVKSTQNSALDQAAIDALRRWKATPGEEWTLNVPITFQ